MSQGSVMAGEARRADGRLSYDDAARERARRAGAVAAAGGVAEALAAGTLPALTTLTLWEATLLGLVLQGVRTFFVALGHGSTEFGEVLRIYEEAGVVRTLAVRHETAASHAATALRWTTGKKAGVVTSIGPGAMQAFAGSLAAASDGIGVWHLYGDETTQDEGPNMQQVPGKEQGSFLRMMSPMGGAYSLHTAEAIGPALRRGLNVVDHPHRLGPFFLLMPLNTQPAVLEDFNLHELPSGVPPRLGAADDDAAYERAARVLLDAERVVVRVGGGAREVGAELLELMDLVDGVSVVSPIATGAVPYSHPRVMGVGGSKGSISGNFAMSNADALLVVGSRAVCQSDSSRTGYPLVEDVVNINTDVEAATHYNRTVALLGKAQGTLRLLIDHVRAIGQAPVTAGTTDWSRLCIEAKERWQRHKQTRFDQPTLHDEVSGRDVLTQPAAIKVVTDWARLRGAVTFFDAGDVQANGFQIVEDDAPGATITETGASYMGFATSAVLATAAMDDPEYAVAMTGDGSFTMNPQVLIDGTVHGPRGCIVVFDNRRLAAIPSLQHAQYGSDHATSDGLAVDYVAWARAVTGVQAFHGGHSAEELRAALDRAREHDGLSLVHVPVYFGRDPMGGLGAFGDWNVGNWVEGTQSKRHDSRCEERTNMNKVPNQMYIDGVWRDASDGATFDVVDPATEEVIGTAPAATDADVDAALDAAARGFQRWRATDPWTRSETLRRIAAHLRRHQDDIAALVSQEQGKPRSQAAGEVSATADQFDWYADEARRNDGRVIEARDPNTRILVRNEPVGPIAAFAPSNFPLLLPARKLAPALAAGCSVVYEPAEETPRSGFVLAAACEEAGVPPGVVNAVTGDPARVSERLVRSPIIRKVSLTGSPAVGRTILELAAAGIKPVDVELGGHAPVLVLDDVDPTEVAELTATGKYRNGGQVCIAASRFLVPDSAASPFTERFVARARSLKLAPGHVPDADMGPLENRRRVEATEQLVPDAVDRGARVAQGGHAPSGFDRGFWYEPTVLTGVDPSMAVMRSEPFGPVAPISSYTSLDDAIAEANATGFGLAAFVFTRDLRRAFEVSEQLEAGMVGVNNLTVVTAEAPFGGVKQSGFGREGGSEGIACYSVTKYVKIALA